MKRTVKISNEEFEVEYDVIDSSVVNCGRLDVNDWECYIEIESIDGNSPDDTDDETYDEIGRALFEIERNFEGYDYDSRNGEK